RFLESKTRDDLLALLLELADSYPEVRAALEDREEMQSGRPDRLLASIRKEIRKLTAQPAWRNDWTGEGSAPDYSRVEERLRALLDQGRADDVLSLGEDLLQRGTEQVGQSDDEGELAAAIGACMKIVFEAVPKSSLKPADQLLWIIDAFLQEDYGILEGCEAPWGGKRYAKKDWNEVAETLDKRLQSFPPPPEKEGSFSHDYRRQEVMRWLIDALEKAGRRSEIIPLLEREAPITRCYEQLVDRLLAAKRRDDARRWALDGYAKTIGKWPGIADGLRGRLRKMAENEKDWPAVAAWSAFTFFESPGLATYRDLEKAAKAADAWDAVRPAALRFLETGQEPGQAAGGDSTGWPLPPVDVKSPAPRFRREFPDINTLIDVAIHEKRTDDVLRWHEASRKRKTWFGPGHAKVAEAVKESHPDVSLRIWRDLAEQKIAVVQPAAYQEAAVHLRKMRAVYQKTNREAEWRSYLLALRAQHKAKRRLMQVLDSLEGKRIVES
ncbi:MAG: hypothetical protein NTW86_02395, partial [Candidatus Sumerlaeota bacterium]|nr:hypothetical protein [Candidatus Sumerlaeota bacterium]